MRISDWSSDVCSSDLTSAPGRTSAATPAFSTERFRAEREADWVAFDALLTRLEKKGARGLSSDELLQLPSLYRATLSSLSIARATSLDKELLHHPEALSKRGYFLRSGVRPYRLGRLCPFPFPHPPPAVAAPGKAPRA